MLNYLRPFLIYLFLVSHMLGGSVRATVDANSITINETFTFRIEAQDTDIMPSVNISSLLDEFTIVSGPAQQTNYSWTNGKSTSTKSLSWTLAPNRAGRLVIPELIISTGGNKYKTNRIRINVQKSGAVASVKELFVLTEIDKDELYMGEQVTVTYKLYSAIDLGLDDVDYPKSVGFWQEDLSKPQSPRFNRTSIKGVEYKVATLYKVALFPTKTGSLEISPMSITARVRKNNKRSIWEDPFFSNNRTVRKLIRTDVAKVNVKPYPEGQPADFTGAVGDFNIRTWVDTSEVRVNEAVTLNVELRGTGNINMFSLPEINFPGDMDVFPPNSSFEKEKLWDQYTGTMLWEYILIPRGSGRYQLPRIQLSFLNPKDGSWNKAGAKSISLNVLPGEDDFISSTKGFTKEEISLLGSDIRYNTTSISNWVLRNEPTISIRSLSSHIIAAILFLLPIPITRFKGHRLNNARKRQSNKALKKALKNLIKPEEDPFMQVSRVLYIYLKDRFFLSSEHLDPLSVKRALKGIIEADHLDTLIKILKLCDAGRYGPDASEVQDTLLDDAKNILYKLDSNR
jgi:hypothetical protein